MRKICGMLKLLLLAVAASVPRGIRADNQVIPASIRGIDTSWYAPAKTQINNITSALHANGTYGFIYNSSTIPDGEYGTYNWCNMPHVRPREYVRADKEFDLQYVELIHRHHKRTPYASNSFPIESYQWDCDDVHMFLYGQPLGGRNSAPVFRQGYNSLNNPFIPTGWAGSCSFPQITVGGLRDSWQHGADLYAVYHGLLGFLPAKHDDYRSVVRYRVTNNIITSQVAGMVINGMWSTNEPFPLLAQAVGVDSLEPQYSCSAADKLFNAIKSSSNPDWKIHLDLSASLFQTLDGVSGVPSSDGGFHASFDHYYDNLSARQCHDRPLPCKLAKGQNSTPCVSQGLADAVYRMGHWEYSQIYRDHPSSLPASASSLGVWVGELTNHLRDVINGQSKIRYYHNIAHDGSVSRFLSILQIDKIVWPGMGSEVVLELYRRKTQVPNPYPASTPEVSTPKPTYQATTRSSPSECINQGRLSSACACLSNPTTAVATSAQEASQISTSSPSEYYVRVLFGGQVLKSSNPTLGRIDMLPVEVMLDYLEGLVGKGGHLIKSNCEA